MNEAEEVKHNNMVSNLPLLFANGYPTSLDKITQNQLENFIPFMVQCSLGNINIHGKVDYGEPEWWPEDIPFTIPLCKPRKFNGSWIQKMKEIVKICYGFHKSDFLLHFCRDLTSHEQASLRFINNYNSTTSLYDRRNNKLLVTFRNENMSYDHLYRYRKSLLQQKSKTQIEINHPHMVESAPFDIYLCDNCDAELYSYEAILEHEKTCCIPDEVIICDSPEPEEDNDENVLLNATKQTELRKDFLLNFGLQSNESSISSNLPTLTEKTKEAADSLFEELPNGNIKSKRLPKRNRGFHSVKMCPFFPWSSPAGQILLKKSKAIITNDYLSERLERAERFCRALPIDISRPKFLEKKILAINTPRTFKKPPDYSLRQYIFPRKTFCSRKHKEDLELYFSWLTKRCCRPVSVRLKKLTENDIKQKKLESSNLNIKLRRDNSEGSNWKIASPFKSEDIIDLCSSDDGEDFNVKEDDSNLYLKLIETELTPKKTIRKSVINKIPKSPLSQNDGTQALTPSCSTSLIYPNSYSGNFTLSQTPIIPCSTLKPPLHPKSYLYSNCSTSSNNNDPLSIEICHEDGDHSKNSQNQENLNKSNNNFNENFWFLNNHHSRNNNINNNLTRNNRRASHSNGKVITLLN